MITELQLQIYKNLFAYAQTGETFYTVDQIGPDGHKYRVFSYRLGSYTDFMQTDALEGRGIMFELDANDTPVRLACRPIHKFFNLNENPSTMNLDISADNIELVTNKADGSLISTWLDSLGYLQLKSKTSLGSDQVQMAWNVIRQDKHLETMLFDITSTGHTVNMEYTGPDNRIVIGYERPRLIVLNIRNNETGEYVDDSFTYWTQHPLYGYGIEAMEPGYDLEALKDATGFEGVVVILKTGQWFKLKTPWYAALHHTKDSINSKRRLFECIVQETADDLKAMFFDDPTAIKLIVDMENLVKPKLAHFVRLVEDFYTANKDLDRKSYAIKGQQELQREVFSLAMSKYLGREVDYKEWAVKHIELFGVKDEVIAVEE